MQKESKKKLPFMGAYAPEARGDFHLSSQQPRETGVRFIPIPQDPKRRIHLPRSRGETALHFEPCSICPKAHPIPLGP